VNNNNNKSLDRSIYIATDYELDGRVSIPGRGKIFLYSTASRPVMEPTPPPIQLIPEVKRLGREADHSSIAEVKKGGAIPPIPIRLHDVVFSFFFLYFPVLG
jgi:hypothetical protein